MYAFATASAAETLVLSGFGDISGDKNAVRKNSVAGTVTSADLGTGNFNNQPLFLLSSAGTSKFNNGHLYPLIIVPRLTTPEETAATEAWVAAKTGVTLP
jgi:hypothetical protein